MDTNVSDASAIAVRAAAVATGFLRGSSVARLRAAASAAASRYRSFGRPAVADRSTSATLCGTPTRRRTGWSGQRRTVADPTTADQLP
jgi:hypothetical protein